MFLEIPQNSEEKTFAKAFFLIKLQLCKSLFIKIETLAQLFPSEFCKIFKNIFFAEHLWIASESVRSVGRSSAYFDQVKFWKVSLWYWGIMLKSYYLQKQPPEAFCKKRCFSKFRKIHRKTPVPETLFVYTDFLK